MGGFFPVQHQLVTELTLAWTVLLLIQNTRNHKPKTVGVEQTPWTIATLVRRTVEFQSAERMVACPHPNTKILISKKEEQ